MPNDNLQSARGFSPKPGTKDNTAPRTPSGSKPKINVDEKTLGTAMTVYANKQAAISHSIGGFIEGAVDAVDQGVRAQVQEGFNALTEAAIVAFVEETVAQDTSNKVGSLEPPKYQFKSRSRRVSLEDLNAKILASQPNSDVAHVRLLSEG